MPRVSKKSSKFQNFVCLEVPVPVKNKNGLTLSLEELEVKSDNSWESNNDEKAAKKIVNKHLVRLLNFIPGDSLCSKCLSAQILFQNSNFLFRILIQFLESKFSISADILPFHVMIYDSKTCVGILNTDLDSKLKLEF